MKFKKGAASFYIVAFSTLIMVIIAASFAAVIISEVTRTSNDDLAQSAYDSALAGVEDAKLAFYNYQSCASAVGTEPDLANRDVLCSDIVWWMEHQDCDMVAHILGRIEKGDSGEVVIQESNIGNNMQQAYTCVKVSDMLGDYRASLSSANQSRVVRARFDTENGIHASMIDHIKISWYSDANMSASGMNYNNFKNGSVTFPKTGGIGIGMAQAPTPPTISVGLVQTAEQFTLSDFDVTVNGKTDRGMVYLVPSSNVSAATFNQESDRNRVISGSTEGTFIGAYNGSENLITASAVAKTNDKTKKNLPYVVRCNDESDYACSATIKIPQPVGGDRNDDTFVVVVSLPYGKPSTDFVLEFYCADGRVCGTQTVVNEDGTVAEEDTNRASLKWVQIGVDSTGRANDLYRRVETRLEGGDAFSLSTLGVLEILGGDEDSIWKSFSVTREWNF